MTSPDRRAFPYGRRAPEDVSPNLGLGTLDIGFTLVELLVATTLMLLVTGTVFQMLNSSRGMFHAQPEVSDVQQRLRVGVDALAHDLMMAGAGAYAGLQAGALTGFFAPILPLRQGGVATYDDGPGVFKSDAITLFYVPTTSSQATLAQPMPSAFAGLRVSSQPGCPAGDSLCGFVAGMNVLVYDDTGAYDSFTITQFQGDAASLQHNQRGDLSKPYDIGAKVVQVRQRVYYRAATTNQLMRTDGVQPALPVLDNVVALSFEYFGDPIPPELAGVDQRVTYGPKPPALDVVQNGWPPGENCTFQVADSQHVTRLAQLGSATRGLVRLQAADLVDGPWCPDGVNSNRFDADLLRIRRVRVTLRVQTGDASLRGALADGPDAPFLFRGTAVDGLHRVPDQQIQFDVSPRNMNLGR